MFIASGIISCGKQRNSDITKHYSEDFLDQLAKKCKQENSRDKAIASADSLYSTFPSISVADKYRYYDFKRHLFELVRFGDRSYDTAITYIDSMIAVIEDNGLEKEMSKEYLQSFNIRSDYNSRRSRYNNAIKDIARCKELNQLAGDSCLMAENTRTLSLIAIKQSDLTLAASLLKEALLLANTCKKDGDQFVRMQRYLDDLGHIYAIAKKYDTALIYHFAASKYIEQNRQLFTADTLFPNVALQNIYGNIALSYEFSQKYKEAEAYIKKAMVLQKGITNSTLEFFMSEIVLARILYKSGRIDEATVLIEKVLPKINMFELNIKADLLEVKVNIIKTKRQYQEEARYQEWYRLVKDSLAARRIDLLKKNPLMEYEQLDKKYQVELLSKNNRIQRNRATAAIIIGALLILVTFIILFTLGRIKSIMRKRAVIYNQLVQREQDLEETMLQKEKAEKQVREKELFAQEMQLQMEFNEAIIQQRRKISDDMHDELSSSLAALKFYIEDEKVKSVGTSAEKSLTDITKEVSSVYQNARSYMHSLKTNNWETRFSLIGFLKEIQQKFSEKELMKVKLNLDEEKIMTLLNTRQHDQLYHVIKEAFSNVIKHAKATQLDVSVRFKDSNCECVIADNGIGYNKEQIEYGIGIPSIKKRVKEIDGDIKIESISTGTTITFIFPVQ